MSGFRLNPAFERRIMEAAEATLDYGGLITRNALIETLNSGSPGRGRVYQRGSVTHQASAPGDVPAIDTGRLIGSINIARIGPMRVRVGTNVKYAYSLEFGTRRVAARPWVRRTFDREWPSISARMLAFFRRKMAGTP